MDVLEAVLVLEAVEELVLVLDAVDVVVDVVVVLNVVFNSISDTVPVMSLSSISVAHTFVEYR